MTCRVRTGYSVHVRWRDGSVHTAAKWTLTWPRGRAARHARRLAQGTHLGEQRLYPYITEVWVVVGRWTPEAGWHFRRLEYPVKQPRVRWANLGRHLSAVA